MGLFGKKDLIGLDIGSRTIKAVQLRESGSKWAMVSCGYSELPEEIFDLSPIEKKDVLSRELKNLFKGNNFSTKRVAASVSGNSVIVRYVKFPKMSKQDLDKAIQFEAEPYIPFDIHEVNIGTQILGDVTEEGQPKIETVLVAAKKDILQEKIEIIQETDLSLSLIDVDAFAIENAFQIQKELSEETVMLLNIGADTVNMNILENGISKVVRDLFIAGNQFTKSIQKNFSVDFKEAERLKRENGLVIPRQEEELEEVKMEDEDRVNISTVMMVGVRALLGEIERSIEYYQSLKEGGKIDRVVLSGGSALLKNLDAILSKELNVPVEIYNPFSNVSGNIDNKYIDLAPMFAVAVGLATRREGDMK